MLYLVCFVLGAVVATFVIVKFPKVYEHLRMYDIKN